MTLEEKHRRLQAIFSRLDCVAIAFSGGVDSTLLLKVAGQCLAADRILAVTAFSPIFPAHEINRSRELARRFGVRQQLVTTTELTLESFAANGPQRCYHCKQHLFNRLLAVTQQAGIQPLCDGSNQDDLQDYRPGLKALRELGIRSPLLETGFTKADIRELSRQLSLPTWDAPTCACLASRFPYGTRITSVRLAQIETCEDWLRQHRFSCFRVRYHGALARIEIPPDEINRLLDDKLRQALVTHFKQNGFDYVTVDLQGYRSGSLNETLPAKRSQNPAD